MYNVSVSGEYYTFTLPPSSSAPAFRLARRLTPMPCLVRVTSANSQLSQLFRRPYPSSRPFFTLQWALGSSKVWLQPPDSFTTIYIFARHRQAPQLELPPRSRASCSLPAEAHSSPFPTKSAITLTALLQATGPVLQGVRHPASVWSPSDPVLFLRDYRRPGLGLALPRVPCVPRPLSEVLTQYRLAHRHLRLQVLTFLAQGAFRLAQPHSLS